MKSDLKTSEPEWLTNLIHMSALAVLAAGFALRLYLAAGTFLNPDEALHFFIANRDSWAAAYRASLTMAHPPLLIFLLYWWRHLGTSEFMLRLPSVLLGTAFCWIFFKWLQRFFGGTVALVGLIFASLLAPMALLSSELRQYELLLFFAISAAHLLELAFEKKSPGWMALSFICLYPAMLSHYSSLLFVATLGIYGLIRLSQQSNPFGMIATWCAGQIGALAIAIFLYVSHISKIKHTTMSEQAFDSWLYKSYFHAGHDHRIAFIFARTFSVFQFILGQSIIGDIAALMFLAGAVLLWRNPIPRTNSNPSSRQIAILLLLPFVINCAAGLLDLYPYGGTRHSVFLAIFALAGISVAIVRLAGGHGVRSVVIALLIVAVCWAFRSIRHPYIYRVDQSRAQMQSALAYIQEKIPPSHPILVDYESGLELGHYLCNQKPIQYDGSIPGFLVFNCGGRRIVSTINDLWAFDAPMFAAQWNQLVKNAGLKTGDRVWIVQAGWIVKLAEELRQTDPAFQALPVQSFGENIQLFPLTVAAPK